MAIMSLLNHETDNCHADSPSFSTTSKIEKKTKDSWLTDPEFVQFIQYDAICFPCATMFSVLSNLKLHRLNHFENFWDRFQFGAF